VRAGCDGIQSPTEKNSSNMMMLHYQSKKVDVDIIEKFQQFGVLNFHARQGRGVKLTPTIKNK
jgi:hypothetical protein